MTKSMRQDFNGAKTPEGFYEIGAEQAAQLSTEVRIIDVREAVEFSDELGHLARAEPVPRASVAEAAADWDRQGPLVVVCRSGRRSAMAAAMLVGMGFTEVANLVGGMTAVRAGGY